MNKSITHIRRAKEIYHLPLVKLTNGYIEFFKMTSKIFMFDFDYSLIDSFIYFFIIN